MHVQNPDNDLGSVSPKLDSLSIRDLFNDKVILKFLAFITNDDTSGLVMDNTSIEKIENYIDNNSSKWIYRTIIQNSPETRYLVLLQHYLDRNPNQKEDIYSLLSSETRLFMKQVEKFFGLGC